LGISNWPRSGGSEPTIFQSYFRKKWLY